MKKWLVSIVCLLKGHKVIEGNKCPITGAQLLICTTCGRDNMPKHNNGMSFK